MRISCQSFWQVFLWQINCLKQSSMENWDNAMQLECAKSFIREDVLQYMSGENLIRLMEECLVIILNADISQEEFVNQWLQVFKSLCPYLSIEFIRYTVIKKVGELPSLKQTLPWRKIGFDMFWSITLGKGEDILRFEPLVLKTIVSMCSDNNWKIRRDAARYLQQLLPELHKSVKWIS